MSLFDLLPAVHRRRDGEVGDPLQAYLGVLDEVLDAIEVDIVGLYDDWFVETCAEWLVPYLADLLGAPQLEPVNSDDASLRAYVANTIAYRRRKGTPGVLEQLAFDITGWRSHAVEYFELLSATQHLDHLRPGRGGTVDLRDRDVLDRIRGGRGPLARYQGAFDRTARTADVRRIASNRGTHNIANLGLWLWRLNALPLTVSVTADAGGPNRLRFSQLAIDVPAFNVPQTETSIDDLSREANIPGAIRLLVLQADLDQASATTDASTLYYGRGRALEIFDGSDSVDPSDLRAVDLSSWSPVDWDPTNADQPILIDPVSSRLMLPDRFTPGSIRVRSAFVAPADMAGGPYDRTEHTSSVGAWHRTIAQSPLVPAGDHPTLAAGLADWAADAPVDASIEFADSDAYGGAVDVNVPPSSRLVLRSAEGVRAVLNTAGPIRLRGTDKAEVVLDGLLITGRIQIDGPLTVLIRDCTLVPGHGLQPDMTPTAPAAPSIEVAAGHDTRLRIERSITGPIRMPSQTARVEEDAPLVIVDSVVQAPARPAGPVPAVAADNAGAIGVELKAEQSTIAGSVHVSELAADNSIFVDQVEVARLQAGCLRFCFVSRGTTASPSRTPRRYRCEPDLTIETESDLARARAAAGGAPFGPATEAALVTRILRAMVPQFVSTIYGTPGFIQLARSTPPGITCGGEGRTEMGALAQVMAPVRLRNLRRALDHYTRYGTEVGVLHQT